MNTLLNLALHVLCVWIILLVLCCDIGLIISPWVTILLKFRLNSLIKGIDICLNVGETNPDPWNVFLDLAFLPIICWLPFFCLPTEEKRGRFSLKIEVGSCPCPLWIFCLRFALAVIGFGGSALVSSLCHNLNFLRFWVLDDFKGFSKFDSPK